jgi:D-sedoheptulose 7-phosphate isomerase
MSFWIEYREQLIATLEEIDARQYDRAYACIRLAYDHDHTLFLFGNGGSGATASHMVADFQKNIGMLTGRPFKALCLNDSMPLATAWSNDVDFTELFAQQVKTWVKPDDVVIALSGSGQSTNVLMAVEQAKAQGATTIGLTGQIGGTLAYLADISLYVPTMSMQRAEDAHLVLLHSLFAQLEKELTV